MTPTTAPTIRYDIFIAGDLRHSYSIVGPETTEWFSRRPEDLGRAALSDEVTR